MSMRHSLWQVFHSDQMVMCAGGNTIVLKVGSQDLFASRLKELCILFGDCCHANMYDGCVHASIMPHLLQCTAETCTDPPQAVKEPVMVQALAVLQC